MHGEYDREADAVYFALVPEEVQVTRTVSLDPQRNVDYDERGRPVGIEFLAVSRGVELDDLPCREELMRYFKEHDIRVFA